jgi:hypothetical protein
MKQALNIIGLLVIASALHAAAPEERIWQLKLADQPSGSFTETTTRHSDGKVVTREVMAMELNRLGNKVEMKVEGESTEDAQTAGGYAKETSDEYKKKQSEAIARHVAKSDVAISTALRLACEASTRSNAWPARGISEYSTELRDTAASEA